ncbi:Sugar-specific transcriptional regulator TrmB [Clostridium sp. C105KSO15]|nr:Sugar-specific transcriptional regulator TrmB [Clostridium sp. C105KSO15]
MKTEISSQVVFINEKLSRIRNIYARWAQKRNLSFTTMQVLHLLLVDGSLTQYQICERYEIPRQSVNNVVNNLKDIGYITLDVKDNNRREKLIVLTNEGLEYSKALFDPLFEIQESLITKMNKESAEQLIKLLTIFGDFLEQEIDASSDYPKNEKAELIIGTNEMVTLPK